MERPYRKQLTAALGDALAGRSLAVAESFTGGLVVHSLVATEGSGDWLRGGMVAYDPEIKFSVLGVPRGPVINECAARAMATGVKQLFGADVGLATTGVAGPAPVEGHPAGTVFVGIADGDRVMSEGSRIVGSSDDVCERGTELALWLLLRSLTTACAHRGEGFGASDR